MTSTLKKLSSCSVVALAAAFAVPAFAGGTQAGNTITNTATVNYNVGSTPRSATDNDSFVVDRKIDLVVDETDSAGTIVSPGQTAAVTTFTLQNTSNATLDFSLAVQQTTSGSAATFGGNDSFDATNVKVYRDTNGNGVYNPGTDLEVTLSGGTYYIDELGIDATVRLFVVADIPNTLTGADIAAVQLVATTREGGTAATMGAVVTASGSATAGMDTVFADDDDLVGGLRDGVDSDADDYRVNSANLVVGKSSTLVSDPIPGSPDFHVPGAVVRYCIVVRNTGNAAATSVTLSDTLPADLEIITASLRVNATVNDNGTPGNVLDDTCNTDGVVGGTATNNAYPTADSVSWTAGTVNQSTAVGVVFEATVR